MNFIRTFVGAFAAVLLTVSAASAQLVTSEDPEFIANIMQQEGHSATVTVDQVNDPMIEANVNGIDYRILFYGCSNNRNCQSIAFWTWRTKSGGFSIEDANGWNAVGRYTKVYRDSDGDASLEMDVYLGGGGITRDTFVKYLDLWSKDLQRLIDYVDTGNLADPDPGQF